MPWTNINKSYSFNMTFATGLCALSAFECSEVLINNKSGTSIKIFDNGASDDTRSFLLEDNESAVIRGITNTADVSAKTTSGGGVVYFRSAYYSNLSQR